MTCIYRDSDGVWRRGLHMWQRRAFRKVCLRCGRTKVRTF